ncbi:MAG: hypothetical protein ABGX07_02875, partial [Pirellulaceae bacterium]
QLVNEYQQSTLKAAEEAENAVVQFLNSKNEVDRLALSAEEAGNARDVVLEKYTTGKIGFTAVFILESLVLEQQNALALAQGRQANSLVQVYKALGGGWELRLNRAELVTDQVPEVPIEPEEIDQP